MTAFPKNSFGGPNDDDAYDEDCDDDDADNDDVADVAPLYQYCSFLTLFKRWGRDQKEVQNS